MYSTWIKAQHDYIPLAKPGKFWFFNVIDYSFFNRVVESSFIWTGGDTIVSNKKYVKMYKSYAHVIDTSHLEAERMIALIRDDSVAKKVYLLPIDTSLRFCSKEEHILYDFNVSISDVDGYLDSCMIDKSNNLFSNPSDGKIHSVLSDLFEYGKNRIAVFYNIPTPYAIDGGILDILLEGIGPASYYNTFFYDDFNVFKKYAEGSFADNGIKGHKYTPLSKKGKFWFYNLHDSTNVDKVIDKYFFWTGGDTIVNNHSYVKLFKSSKASIDTNHLEKEILIALLRDDTIYKKVYILPVDLSLPFCKNEEHLLYDFTLQTEEYLDDCLNYKTSFENAALSMYGKVRLTTSSDIIKFAPTKYYGKDDILLFLTTKPKSNLPSGFPIVEGKGLLQNSNLFYADPYSGFVDYCEGTFKDCLYPIKTDEYHSNPLKIYPNPTSDFMTIEGLENINGFKIFDIKGTYYNVPLNINVADLSNLKSGLYFFEITDKSNFKFYGKIVKQ